MVNTIGNAYAITLGERIPDKFLSYNNSNPITSSSNLQSDPMAKIVRGVQSVHNTIEDRVPYPTTMANDTFG